MVCAALGARGGFEVLALTIDYHQRHRVELEAARAIAAAARRPPHRPAARPQRVRRIGADRDIAVPKDGVERRHSGHLCPGAQHGLPEPGAGLGRSGGRARPVRRGQRARLFGLSRLPAGIHRRVRGARQPGDQGRGRGRGLHHPRAAAQHMTKADIAARRRGSGSTRGSATAATIPRPTAARAACATPAGCAPRASRKPGCPTRRATHDLMARSRNAFLTLQGEGVQAGSRAVFLRFAGCNLWSGREQDRATAQCNFCDTDFVGTDGEGGGKFADAESSPRMSRRCGARARASGWW
jgi:hypothetical protein